MKKFFFLIIFLAIVSGAGYFAYATIKHVPDGQLLIVFDTTEDRVLYSCETGWHVIPYTVIPGRVSLYPVDTSGAFSINLELALPELTLLDDDEYSIHYGLSLEYELQTESFVPTKSFLTEPEKIIQSAVSLYARNAFTELLSNYVGSSYDPVEINNDWNEIKTSLFSRIKSGAKKQNVVITTISENSVIKIPSEEIYLYGMTLRDDLLELRKKHAINLESVQHSLDLKAIESNTYYEHLQKISDLISTNPDLLKYMYIEKLGENVEIILPQSITGFPLGLDSTEPPAKAVPQEQSDQDIDNLR
jgi:hypothetical protein